jgi:hypothetical protein
VEWEEEEEEEEEVVVVAAVNSTAVTHQSVAEFAAWFH